MQSPIEIRIELSGEEIPLDISPVHVTDILKLVEGVDDYLPSGDGSQLASSLEIPWASDALGRMLCRLYGWCDDAWTIEESGILATPVYYSRDGQEAQLIKCTYEGPAEDLHRYWRWRSELVALCHLLHITRGTLHVCHTPRQDREAILLAYTYEFPPQEITSLWDMLLTLKTSYRVPKENPS